VEKTKKTDILSKAEGGVKKNKIRTKKKKRENWVPIREEVGS